MNVSCLASVIFSLLASLRLYFGIPPQPTPPVVPFTVVWNVPSAVCHDKYNVSLNLSRYGITHNDNDSFFGKEMVLFYEPTPGLYPKYLRNGSAINGGLPQKSNIEKHLRKVELDIQQTIRGAEFSGLAVVDWESWRPIFDRNIYDKSQVQYITKSEDFVRQLHPTWNDSQVKRQARLEFETSARLLMNKTLGKAREMRGGGKWGFYGFPRCYNYRPGQAYCANDTVQYNNELSWLFNASSALYPSIYLDKDLFPSIEDRALRVQGILRESLRVRDILEDVERHQTKPIYAYTRYRYRQEQFYITSDLKNTIGQSLDFGLDGVVVWDSSANFKNKADCVSLRDYLTQTLGPYIESITRFASQCHTRWCSQHGLCVRKRWPMPLSREYQKGVDQQHGQKFSMYRCVCSQPWTGTHCEQHM